MGVEVRTLYRVECDRCGQAQESTYPTPAKARNAAIEEGFTVSDWMQEGKCPRTTVFCKDCVERLLNEEAKRAQAEPVRVLPRPSML